MAQQRRSGSSAAEVSSPRVAEKGLEVLWGFLFDTEFDDGSKRKEGSITIFVDEGVLKAAFNDKGDRMVGFSTLTCLSDLPLELEEALCKGKVDWRRSRR